MDAPGRAARRDDAGWRRQARHVRRPTLESGAWHYVATEYQRAPELFSLLAQLEAPYPKHAPYLVLYDGSLHTVKLTCAWLAERPQVTPCFRPGYAGQWENPVKNPMEKVWWRLKHRVTANRLYGDVKELVGAIHEFFARFTPTAALRLAA